MKNYYSCIDTKFVKYLPQPLQHLVVGDKATKLGGKIIFYTSEDFGTYDYHGIIRAKVEEKPQMDGIIFFSLSQFFNNGMLNIEFMEFLLDHEYEIHFARENISIQNKETLNKIFPMLYAQQYVYNRDEPRSYWKPIWNEVEKEKVTS